MLFQTIPDIPESVAIAQPILYLFAFTVITIVGGNLWFIKWLASNFLSALSKLNEQSSEQTSLLISIQNSVDDIADNTGGRTRRKRGLGD